jgi:hypothetical protein
VLLWSRAHCLFMSELMGVFINMHKLIGKEFEASLAALKRNAEQPVA